MVSGMAIFTLPEIIEQLAAWKQALVSCSSGQSYTIGSRSLSRADLPEIRQTLEWLAKQRDAMTEGGPVMISQGRPRRG